MLIIIVGKLPLKPAFLLQGDEGWGYEQVIKALAAKLGMHHFKIANSDLMANIYAQNESKLVNVFFSAKLAAPCIVSIHSFEVGSFSLKMLYFLWVYLISFIFTRKHFVFPFVRRAKGHKEVDFL